MRRINYDLTTVNTSVFLFDKETFHFRMIFPEKPWDWESCNETVTKVKKNRELEPLGLGESKSDCWLSQKASKFHKRLSSWKLPIVLIWNIQSLHGHFLSSYKSWKNHNIERSGHNARSALRYRVDVWERSIYDNCKPTCYERVYTRVHICISQCPQ